MLAAMETFIISCFNPKHMILQYLIAAAATVLLFLAFWRFWFLRDPERDIPEGDNIVSPADGKIISVMPIRTEEVEIPKGMLGKVETLSSDVRNAGYLVSIFMTPLNVHVQRAPINGRIARVKYTKGKFLSANTLAALANENNEILIEDIDSVKVIQIAGFIARRIECFVKADDRVIKGDRIGRINLGSQVTMILPRNIKLKVREGQKVKAGETIIAEFGI